MIKVFLTSKCNLNCDYCFEDKRKREPEFSSIIAQIKRARKKVFLKGGEPMLRKDILKILRFAKSRGLEIRLETNGVLLDKKILPYVDELCFVFDSSNFGAWARITRKGRKEFNKSVKAIKMAKRFGNKVYVDSLLTKLSLNSLVETKEFCDKNGAILRVLENPIREGFDYSNSIAVPLKEARFLGKNNVIYVKAPKKKKESNAKESIIKGEEVIRA
jgi:MoaA/NifB/PqqE/SkfB family radical SAM enzyme